MFGTVGAEIVAIIGAEIDPKHPDGTPEPVAGW